MDECIVDVFQIDSEFWATSPQISLRKKVEILILSKQNPDSYIKLAFVDQ